MPEEAFDFIVTGAGSAGAAVAAPLSENGRHGSACEWWATWVPWVERGDGAPGLLTVSSRPD